MALLQAEGGLWKAVGIMTAAGTLRGCVLLLRKLRLPDAAMAFAQAAAEAGFANPAAASDAGASSCMLLLQSPPSLIKALPDVLLKQLL